MEKQTRQITFSREVVRKTSEGDVCVLQFQGDCPCAEKKSMAIKLEHDLPRLLERSTQSDWRWMMDGLIGPGLCVAGFWALVSRSGGNVMS